MEEGTGIPCITWLNMKDPQVSPQIQAGLRLRLNVKLLKSSLIKQKMAVLIRLTADMVTINITVSKAVLTLTMEASRVFMKHLVLQGAEEEHCEVDTMVE